MYSPLLEELIESLRILPGVGPKSAQRMAFHMLQRNREGAVKLAMALTDAATHIGHCSQCRTLSELDVCKLCENSRRDRSLLCIIEQPSDVVAIEQSGVFSGLYFVLMGRLSPLDGIGPNELGLDVLERRLDSGEITEVVLATNPTVEGEATAHYIHTLCTARGIAASRIAHGVPIGGELEFIDSGTLAHALSGRLKL